MYQYNYLFSLKNRYAIDILRIDVSTNTITWLTLYQKLCYRQNTPMDRIPF